MQWMKPTIHAMVPGGQPECSCSCSGGGGGGSGLE